MEEYVKLSVEKYDFLKEQSEAFEENQIVVHRDFLLRNRVYGKLDDFTKDLIEKNEELTKLYNEKSEVLNRRISEEKKQLKPTNKKWWEIRLRW